MGNLPNSPHYTPETPINITFQDSPDKPDKGSGQVDFSCALGDASTTEKMKDVLYVLPKLHGSGNDSSKWYVDFYCLNPEGKLVRKKKVEGFNECTSIDEIKAHGAMLCLKYESKLKAGWNPYQDKRVVFKNHLEYHATIRKREDPDFTIEYWLNFYIDQKKIELRDKTITTYLTKLRMFASWLKKQKYDRMLLSAFTAQHAQQFLNDLRQGAVSKVKVASKTYNSYLQTLETAWTWLESFDEKLVIKNPWKKFPSLKTSPKRKILYTKKQRDEIFAFAYENNRSLWLVIQLIYRDFIRPGREIAGIQVQDIDFNQNKIWIEGDISKNKKTAWLPLPEDLAMEFIDMNLQSLPGQYYVFGKFGPSEQQCSRDYWSKLFTRIFRKRGLHRGQTIYTFKDTGNCVAHMNGMPLVQQKELNRHHSLDQMYTYVQGLAPVKLDELKLYFKD